MEMARRCSYIKPPSLHIVGQRRDGYGISLDIVLGLLNLFCNSDTARRPADFGTEKYSIGNLHHSVWHWIMHRACLSPTGS